MLVFDLRTLLRTHTLAWNNTALDIAQSKFKNPLAPAEHFYLQYKIPSELYPINIELSQQEHVVAAFKKFAALEEARGTTFSEKFRKCFSPEMMLIDREKYRKPWNEFRGILRGKSGRMLRSTSLRIRSYVLTAFNKFCGTDPGERNGIIGGLRYDKQNLGKISAGFWRGISECWGMTSANFFDETGANVAKASENRKILSKDMPGQPSTPL